MILQQSYLERILGPRPQMTLVMQDRLVTEIWVNGRAPRISVHDYDWGETDRNPNYDRDGAAFSRITWREPAWRLGLCLPVRDVGLRSDCSSPQ